MFASDPGSAAEHIATATFLFTDIEGSTRLWETAPERAGPALVRHDAIAREAVAANRGTLVKMAGDGIHAAFADPVDAVNATLQLQFALLDFEAESGMALRVRCGLHLGTAEARDQDYFGAAVNRAARIMGAAHGGQVLLSQAVAACVEPRLPEGVALRDLGLVRLRDLASPERVFQAIHPRLRRDFPALRSLEATPNNLPQQATSFVGRDHDIAEVTKQLSLARLVTLSGPGGIGKTRLSLQVAADIMESYPDGVWFVELAALTDPQMVPLALASVVGVREESGRSVNEALARYVEDRKLLIVLDNCEHLAHACAQLAKLLLHSGSHARVLTSSREPLRIAGETTYVVPALGAPDTQAKHAASALARFDSVRLFAERAAAVQPGFRIADRDAEAVQAICHRLAGIPLAIELAAARTRTMSVHAISARLDDRFRLLTGGDRTALPRQQTLRASIDWSYDLLADGERTLLQWLAVFAGGFTLETAEAVCGGNALPRDKLLDTLSRLVEKSLVSLDAERERYRLLETVRQYAQERAIESGAAHRARECHLSHFVAFVETARPELYGPAQVQWLARLDQERENLLAAHAAVDQVASAPDLGPRLVNALKNYWTSRGLLALGHRVTLEMLDRPGAQTRDAARSRGLFDVGWICSLMGRYADAERYLEESLTIAREIGNEQRVAAALQPLGMARLAQGKVAAARTDLEEALALAQRLGKKREVAAAMTQLAQLHRVDGRPNLAEPLYSTGLEIARDLGDRESAAIGLLNLVMVAIGADGTLRAAAMLREVLAIVTESRSTPLGQSALEVCAGYAVALGASKEAARFYGAAEARAGETGMHRDFADEAFLMPLIARARDALGPTAFEAAERAGRKLTFDDAMREVSAWLAARG